MMAALHQLHVQLPISGRGNAEITLVNWGSRNQQTDVQWQHLALGDAMTISFYEEAEVVFNGEITAIEERYGSGTPMLILLVEDSMHRLAKSRQSRVFEEMSPNDMIESIASAQGLQTDVSVSSSPGDWNQINETDYNFMQRIISRWDLSARIVDGNTLRIKPEQADAEPFQVSPQSNALEIRIIADLNHQVQMSGIRGWNFDSGEQIEDESSSLQPAAQNTTAAAVLQNLNWSEQEWLSHPHPRNQQEAREWATAAFQKQARQFLHGDILLQGSPGLKPGREIELDAVSNRITGRYRIVHLTHRFDTEAGFVSHIRVERPCWNQST
jgi:phage protein D